MPESSLPSPFSTTAYAPPTTSPLPTPPSSTSIIPIQCFPSPTSVADIANSTTPATIPKHSQSPPVPALPRPRPLATRTIVPHFAPRFPTSTTSTITSIDIIGPDHPAHPDHPDHPDNPDNPHNPHNSDNPDLATPEPSSLSSTQLTTTTVTALSNLSSISTTTTATSANNDAPPDPVPFYFPKLINTFSSSTLPPVAKPQFIAALSSFTTTYPPGLPVPDLPAFVASLRRLLDHLDALAETLPLKQTTNLFQALSTLPALQNLLFLLSDISATSEQADKDARKAYRYPHLVSAILANGNMVIRDAFIADPHLIHHLLSFLDSDLPLHPSLSQLPSPPTTSPSPLTFARNNTVIVVNVVNILVSYLDTSPDVLLAIFETRPTWVPALVNLLYIGAVPDLFISIIPETSVHQLSTSSQPNVAFHSSLTSALNTLANASVFHLLADAFIRAAQTIFSQSDVKPTSYASQHAHQFAYNITDVYDALMIKLIRPIRINPNFPACKYLNVYSNPSTAATVVQILRAATHLFMETAFEQSSLLSAALTLTLRLLRILQHDRDLRVPSVVGPPPPLTTDGLEVQLQPALRDLISLLIDLIVSGDQVHSSVRLHIVDVFVECSRIGSSEMLDFIHSLRFGEVAFKMILMYPRNSLLHHSVCRGVEDALISRTATPETAHHWIVRSNLARKIMITWRKENGSERWGSVRAAQDSPFLSAIVHMACCIHHWLAMEIANGTRRELVMGADLEREFTKFWNESMSAIVGDETPLGGCKPRRRNGTRGAGGMGMSFGLGGGGGRMMRWAGATRNIGSTGFEPSASQFGHAEAHLVRSESAHRFGFVEPDSSLRSRFDDVFVEGEDDFGEGGSVASLFDVGDGVG